MIASATDFYRLQRFKALFYTMANHSPPSRNAHFKQARQLITHNTKTIQRIFTMASKKSSKITKKFQFNGYVNIHVAESETDKVNKHIADTQTIYEEINELAKDGYSLKIYYDSEQANFRASITCMNAEDDNYGYVLSAYASDWFTAIGVLTYKHYDVAKESWTDYTQNQKNGWG